jgi:hypothetical protein
MAEETKAILKIARDEARYDGFAAFVRAPAFLLTGCLFAVFYERRLPVWQYV